MSVKGVEAGIEHGTMKGYRQHTYREIPACEPCLAAVRQNNAAKKPRATRSEAQAAWYGGQFQHQPGASQARDVRAEAAPLSTGTVRGRDLQVGDVIDFCGRHYRVDRITPYAGSLRAELGEGTRVAYSGEWGMTIGPDRAIRVAAREARHAS